MDRVLSQFEDVAEVATATPGAAAWTAREPGQDRRVLIKRLPDERAKTRATQALALRHPHVVPTRRWLRDDGSFYVVRDYVPGRNLRQALGDLSQRAFDRLQDFLSPILDALDYAHQAGLPHGGVTPENVLVAADGSPLLSDFATIDDHADVHIRYVPRSLLTQDGQPTVRADYYALCEIYKEFLPERARDDEAGQAARARLLRNLTETQQTCRSADELRYKLDAVAKMAELLGFASSGPVEVLSPRGARLVCAVTPPTAAVNPGGGTSVVLSVRNEGDILLHVESVGSDVVWLNYHMRFTPFGLAPDSSRDLIFTLSGARLRPGTYNANLLVRSNSGMQADAPPPGTPWHEQTVALPVLVKGGPAEAAPPGPVPLAEKLPLVEKAPPPEEVLPALPPPPLSEFGPRTAAPEEHPGIACVQEPDPALVRYGQIGVVHIGVKNIGPQRLRVDKISTWPHWLAYPGDFQALWIEPGATQYLGFSVLASTLTGGDYKAEVTFITSVLAETMLGVQPVWREMKCEVRVRVVRGAGDVRPALSGPAGVGCAPLLLALASSMGLLAVFLALLR